MKSSIVMANIIHKLFHSVDSKTEQIEQIKRFEQFKQTESFKIIASQ
jgi:hypothetical protein